MWPWDAPRRYNRHYGWVTVPSVTSQWVDSQNSLFFPCFMNSGVRERSNVSTFPIPGKFIDRPEAIHCWKVLSRGYSLLLLSVFKWIMHKMKPLNCAVSFCTFEQPCSHHRGASTSARRTGSCTVAGNDGTPLLKFWGSLSWCYLRFRTF